MNRLARIIQTSTLAFILCLDVSIAQQSDTSSYFPLGFWGIWIDPERPPFNPTTLTSAQWAQERTNWQDIEGNFLVAWTPMGVEDNVIQICDDISYKLAVSNSNWDYSGFNTNSLPYWLRQGDLSDTNAAIAIINEVRNNYNGHSGFHSYYFDDEHSLNDPARWSGIQFAAQTIHSLDPARKSLACAWGARPADFYAATPALDIYQSDVYPFFTDHSAIYSDQQWELDNNLMPDYNNLMNRLWGRHTEWQAIIQSQGEERGGGTPPRRPNFYELRAMTYLALSRGARGITYFVYGSRPYTPVYQGFMGLVDTDPATNTRIRWEDVNPGPIAAFSNVKSLNHEIALLGPTIRKLRVYDAFPNTAFPRDNVANIISVSGDRIEIGVFKRFDVGPDSTSYFMLVNRVCNDESGDTTGPQAVSVSFAHPTYEWLKITEVVSGSQWVIAGTGSGATFTDDLGPGAGKLYRMEEADLSTLAAFNKSASSTATANSSQRKLYLESSGKLHEVFESGGAVFYRNTTNGGSTWDVTLQLSSGDVDNSAPSISVTGSTVVASWQYSDGEEGYTVYFLKSTDGGQSWSSPSSRAAHLDSPDPGPIPSIAGYSGGNLALAYQRDDGLRMQTSTNTGSNWTTLTVPGTGSGFNSPSCAISSTYWSTSQANLAYASDVPSGSPSILYNYYDYPTSTWGTAINLSSIVSGQYAHHANPCLAVSATEASGGKYTHVAWDAEDINSPGTRVIVHRKGSFRAFYNEYSILQYQSQNKPSISGLSDAAAWVVYQNSSGYGVWKMHYNGSYWDGSYGTYVSQGCNPQISVGYTQARYLWTQGSAPPYQIELGTSALSKSGGWHYARSVNVLGPDAKSSITFTLNAMKLVHKGGVIEEAQYEFPSMDTTALTYSNAMNRLESAKFIIGEDVDSIVVEYSITGINTESLQGQKGPQLEILLTDHSTLQQTTLMPKDVAAINPIRDGRADGMVSFVVPASLRGKNVSIGARFCGLADTSSLTYSIGHIYSYTGAPGSLKEVGSQTQSQVSLPKTYSLDQNYPNPFNPSTRMDFALPRDGMVSLVLYDVLGRTVARLADGMYAAGRHTATWAPGAEVASGVYFARLVVQSEMGDVIHCSTQKVLLQK